MSAVAENDDPEHDTTARNGTSEPSAKRPRPLESDGQHEGTRILVLQDLGNGQQVLVEASPDDIMSESAGGLHTLAETAALEVSSACLSENTVSILQDEEGNQQTVYIASHSSPDILSTSQGNSEEAATQYIIRSADGDDIPMMSGPVNADTSSSTNLNLPSANSASGRKAVNEDDVEDTHRCGKCGVEFTTLEEYIKHKLYGNQCRMKSKTVISGRGIFGDDLADTELDLGALLRPRGRGRGRGHGRGRGRGRRPADGDVGTEESSRKAKTKYKWMSIVHSEDNIYVHEEYKCPNCDKTFRREAALNRHVEYDHVKREDDSADELDYHDQDNDYTVDANSVTNDDDDDSEPEEERETVTAATPTPTAAATSTGAATTTPTVTTAAVKGDGTKQISTKKPDDYVRRPYGCSICKARFKEVAVLRAHLLTHSDKRDYRCTWENCRFAFKTKGSLKRHLRRHTGERPFKCDQCQRSFRESGALTRHLKARTSCKQKTDSDLPRYGKQAELVLPLSMVRRGEAESLQSNESHPTDSSSPNIQIISQPRNPALLNIGDLQVETQIQNIGSNQCRVCLMTIEDKDELREHLKTHLAPTQLRCDLCTYTTEKQENLTLHRQITHHIQPQVETPTDVTGESSENLVVLSDLPAGSEQVVVEQVLEQYISQGHDLNDLTGEATATAIINGQEVQFHIIRADSVRPDDEGTAEVHGQDEASQADTALSHVDMADISSVALQQLAQPVSDDTHVGESLSVELTVDKEKSDAQTSESSQPSLSGYMLSNHQTTLVQQVESESGENFSHLVSNKPESDAEQQAQEKDEAEADQVCVDEEILEVGEREMTVVSADPVSSLELLPSLQEQQQQQQPITENPDLMNDGNEQDDVPAADQTNTLQSRDYTPDLTTTMSDKQTREAALALQQLLELRDGGEEVVKQSSSKAAAHQCPVCQRTFRGFSYLRHHMRSHTGERPYHCELCDKTFATKDTLTKHMVAHSSDRRYKCGECGKMFKRISHVHEHLRIHSSERPYPCTYCDKTFKAPNACKVHLRTHTDELQWECSVCHRLFREKASMDRHMRIHTGEKPYKCEHCGRCFSEHGTLSRHLKAKFPCTRQLQLLREQQNLSQAVDVVADTEVVTEVQTLQLADTSKTSSVNEGKVAVEMPPSLLAEFSSLAADTQQYIIQRDGTVADPTHLDTSAASEQGTTQYVMVTADGQEQALEIISAGQDETGLLNAQIVVLDDSNMTLRMEQSEDEQSAQQLLTVIDSSSSHAEESFVTAVDNLQHEVVADVHHDQPDIDTDSQNIVNIVMADNVSHEAIIEATLVDNLVHPEVVEEQVDP